MSRRLPLLAALSAAVLSAGATAVVSIAQDPGGGSAGAESGNSAAGFPAQERAQVASDRLPAGVQAKFGVSNASGPQVSESSARKVAHIANSDIFIAEGPKSFCSISVADAGWSGGCTSKAHAGGGEPQASFDLVASPDGNDYRVWGVAPRAVKRVALARIVHLAAATPGFGAAELSG